MPDDTPRRKPPGVSRGAVLAAIRAYTAEHGYPPAMTDLARATGLAKASVVHHLNALAGAGLIRRHPKRPRAIVLTGSVAPVAESRQAR